MVRDLVIHIGDPKTGTTAIQEVLATGGWQAPGLTALYPAKVNHLSLARSFYDPAEREHRAARMAGVARAIAASDADVAVISAELFEQADPAELAAALARHLPALAPRARIVAYVRPHADRLVSAWAERVKQGNTTDGLPAMAARAMAKGQFLYAPRLARWRAVFGSRLVVRPFLRDRLAGGDVVADFLGIVAEGRPVTITRPATANESLSLADLAMLAALHRRVEGRADLTAARRAIGWNLAQHLGTLPRPTGSSDRPRLPVSLVPAVQAAYGDDAAAMDAAFFGGVPTLAPALARAAETAVAAEPSLALDDHFGPDDRRLIAVWTELAATMLDHDPDLIPAHFRARQQAVYDAARTATEGAGPGRPDAGDSDGDSDGDSTGGRGADRRRPGKGGAGKGGAGKGGAGKRGAGKAGAGKAGAGPEGPADLDDAALAAFLPPDLRRKPGGGKPGGGTQDGPKPGGGKQGGGKQGGGKGRRARAAPAPRAVPRTTRLVLHIGDPKTGSSSIQRTLFEGRHTAAPGRIAYPDALDAIPLARSVMDGAAPGAAAERFASLAGWLDGTGAEVAVVSAEHFAFVDPARLAAALDAARPGLSRRAEVVAYVRPHPGRLLSAWGQQVKTGSTVRPFLPWLDTAIARGRFLAAPRFAAWAAVYGDRFTLRPMLPGHLAGGDVVADFLRVVLGDPAVVPLPGGRRNESLASDHLAAMGTVQQVLRNRGLDPDLCHSIGAALQDRLGARPGAAALPRPVLPAAALPRLAAAYGADAAAIDAAFFAPDRPLSDALAAATGGGTGGDDPLDPDATVLRVYGAAGRRALRTAARALADLPHPDLAAWRSAFVGRRRARSGDPQPDPGPRAVEDRLDTLAGLILPA